ncbi:PHD domain-containing protein [Cephalotus follicularis]|uniref:PHD domain-containing protein n=1 Tax=Cephalotus follicularis TaxID=3775 RepID=A0A1Q3AY31_CEPFO|nr:PHD domain-containing protein [Cephalotus follicularis]
MYGFHTFADPGCPMKPPTGAFRDNIRVFLHDCAETEDYDVHGMPIWCTLLVHETKSFVIPLYTIEEDVYISQQPYCDHCKCTGWRNHFVSKRKYHVIIPVDVDWNTPLGDGVFDKQTHLLHGLIHCNGYGHLLCINGIEGGSKNLCGREIMDLWDRICAHLRTRKITVEDLAKKRSMDLRLLHGVAYGHSWFGRWGYRFCRGSFGVTEHNYDRAIEVLSSLELNKVIADFSGIENFREIKQIVRYYRDMSEDKLITIKDLLRFMLTVKYSAPSRKRTVMAPTTASSSYLKPSNRIALQRKATTKEKDAKCKRFSSVIANMDSRWPARRLEYTAGVIVDALKEKKGDKYSHGGMTRQDVRDAARIHIGDTGLLDYVLKSLNNVIVGSYIVRRSVNPTTRILEYTIHEHGNGVNAIEPKQEVSPVLKPLVALPGADVYSDVVFLYTNVLLNYPESELVELATQAVLESKRFVKEWPYRDESDQLLSFICQVMPNLIVAEAELTRELPPGEVVVVPLHATVVELKLAVESAFKDTYCIMENFWVTGIDLLEDMEDEDVLFGAVESGSLLRVRGIGIDLGSNVRYQGGADNWMVRCECGAQDDDGERMVACDVCEVWQHTHCCGIEDSEIVPPLFVCPGCCDSLVPPKTESSCVFEGYGDLLFDPVAEYTVQLQY